MHSDGVDERCSADESVFMISFLPPPRSNKIYNTPFESLNTQTSTEFKSLHRCCFLCFWFPVAPEPFNHRCCLHVAFAAHCFQKLRILLFDRFGLLKDGSQSQNISTYCCSVRGTALRARCSAAQTLTKHPGQSSKHDNDDDAD